MFSDYVGGLVGYNSAGISNSYATGAVKVGAQSTVFGGLVGVNSGSINNCHSTGTITSTDYSTSSGGLVGSNSGNIDKCYSIGDVYCGDWSDNLGGLTGGNSGSINSCYSTGTITAERDSHYLGGLVGYNANNINNCYSMGSVNGDQYIGGLIGQNDGNISNCYSSGHIDASFSGGGLVGYGSGNISSCCFLINSGRDNGRGIPLTDEQMKYQTNFIGWDFVDEITNGSNNFWWLCNEGLEYPRLAFQYLLGDLACPGVVGIEDLAVMCEQWLKDGANADISPSPDGDGIVDFNDFAIMAGNWMICFVTEAISPQPDDQDVNVNRNTLLRWVSGQSCTSHDVYFDGDFNNVNNADTSSSQFMGNQILNTWDTNNYAPNGLDLNTIYYWRIDEAAMDCTTKGNIWSFTVTPLRKAINPQPSDGQTNVTKHPILSWGTNADSHDVYFGTSYNDVNVATRGSSEYKGNQDINNWDTKNYAPAGLDLNTMYYWRIDEIGGGLTIKGDVWRFTVASIGKAANPQPSDGQTNIIQHPILYWTAGTYTETHDVYFGTSYNDVNDATCDSNEYKGNQTIDNWDTNNYSPNGLNLSTVYYWRIDERSGDLIAKGNVWRFTVVLLGKAFSPSPWNGQTNVIPHQILRWYAGPYTQSHDVYLGTNFNEVNNATHSSSVYKGNQNITYWDVYSYPPAGFVSNTTYYWRIDELAGSITTKGDIWKFTVAPLVQATNPWPSDGQISINLHAILIWTGSTYADFYDVYFGTSYTDVNGATQDSSEYRGNQNVTYWDTNNIAPAGLDLNTDYYWRIDEVAGSLTKGKVWKFTTRNAIDPNLMHWWTFNDGAGNVAYDSAGRSNGTILGGTTWTAGHINGAISFNGSSNYVDCGSVPSNYDNITVSAWMKTSASGVVVSNRYNSLGYGTWYTLSSTGIELGGNHIVYTKNGTNHSIYIDGSLDQSFTSNADISWVNPLYIGRRGNNSSSSLFFNGVIDDVRIYNRALSTKEVSLLSQKISVQINLSRLWMYQNLPNRTDSNIIANAVILDDPLGNSDYTYTWEIEMPDDVTVSPITVAGGGTAEANWTFAAPGCNIEGGLSDSGLTFKVKVTILGNDFGNSGTAEKEFAIALLGDINNDGTVNITDRSIANMFMRTGAAGSFTLKDCDLNCDGTVNITDRSIANSIMRGALGTNYVSSPCPLR
jgi:hypothetical protein